MINYYEYYDFFSRGGIWNTKSRKRLALCVCVFVLCCGATHYRVPKRFLSLRRSNFVLEMLPRDVGKFGDWFA